MYGSARPAEQRGLGIALRIGAVTLFGAMMASLKYGTTHGVHPAEILFYRNVFALPAVVLWVLLDGGFKTVRTSRPKAHAVRAVLGLAVMACTFAALAMLPLAEATVISFSAPLFATMLSALVLGERVLRHRWTAIVVGFVGVLIVLPPGDSSLPAAGVGFGLLAAFGTAVVVITLRQIGETESATATVFWFTLASSVAMACPMPFFLRNHAQDVWIALVLGGLCGGAAQIMMTAAVRYAPVSVLAPFDYLQLVWAVAWGYLLFAALPSSASVLGGTLIAAAGLYVVWRERRIRRQVVPSPSEL